MTEFYADSDFFLALIKSEDWLKAKAREIARKHKGHITTSPLTVIEVLMVARRFGLDLENVAGAICEIATVDNTTAEECMQIANLVQIQGFHAFDAAHAVLSRGRPIISSEKKYKEIGIEQVYLGK